MAREHARILTSIWDPSSDFRLLGPAEQRLYFLLLSQRSLNHAGVLPLTVRKWAGSCAGTSIEDVWTSLKALDAARYVVVDTDTEEVLIRSFIRNDGIARQPNVLKAALRLATGIESPRLRAALAGELRRLGTDIAGRVADELVGATEEPLPEGLPEPIAEPLPKGSGNPGKPVDKNPSGTPREPLARDAGEGEGEGGSLTYSSGQVLKKGPGTKTITTGRPSERCTRHTTNPTADPCRPCRETRLAAEQWDRDQAAASARCGLCDGDGWRWDPAGKHRGVTSERCDHQPARQATG
jgi:hypothetical protein